jgi:DnaA initiator-associating protein
MQEYIRQLFTENIQTMIATGEALYGPIESAALGIVQALINDRKVLCCGEGAATALAAHMAQLLVDQFETERPCLPAVALQSNLAALNPGKHQPDDLLARQVRALGQDGDILLVLSLTGEEAGLIKAVEAALTKDMTVIALTVDNNGELSGLLGSTDVELKVPAHRPARVFECYVFLLHCVCELIDSTLFPQQHEHM